jgi:hypothetical protein
MSATASANRRMLLILVAIGAFLFIGSLLFIISRAH